MRVQPPDPDPATDPRNAIAGHIAALRAFALSLSRDATLADDLVQETLLKSWSRFAQFTPGTDLRAWLFTILRNTFYAMERKTRREVADPDGTLAGRSAEPPHHDERLAFGEFLRAFDRLTPEHREVLILVGVNGYSYAKAAEVIGVAPGTAKSRASRARARLADLLQLKMGKPHSASARARSDRP